MNENNKSFYPSNMFSQVGQQTFLYSEKEHSTTSKIQATLDSCPL
jgi:hypothetical protein